jgi:uncharacterized protein YdaU (DUF1376 family)
MAADRLAYFQFYPRDFTSDDAVECMETEAVGAYLLLLCKAWHQIPAGTLPNDDLSLAKWARLSSKKWSQHRDSILRAFYIGDDGRLHQKRMEVEYAKALETIAKRSKAGSEAAAARWERMRDGCESHGDGMPNASESDANGNANAMRFDAIQNQNQNQNQNQKEKTPPTPRGLSLRDEVLRRWNSIDGVSHAKSMTASRAKALAARSKEPAWTESWQAAAEKVSASSFCRGGGSTGWVADLDWFLKPDTVTKILEGKYDDRQATNGHGGVDLFAGLRQSREIVEQLEGRQSGLFLESGEFHDA